MKEEVSDIPRRKPMTEIDHANWPADLADIQSLFQEYAQSLGVDLSFQDFAAEVAALPGKYLPPAGRLLVARHGAHIVGCCGLRPLVGNVCEMKRLYVQPQARGGQLGLRLAVRILEEAREAGYGSICLDTLPTMAKAQSLYASLGFVPIAPYVFNPVQGTQFLGRDL